MVRSRSARSSSSRTSARARQSTITASSARKWPRRNRPPPLSQLLEILQKQLAFGRDVELAIDAQSVVLDGSDRDAQATGDQRRRVAGKDQPDQLALAAAELRP